MQEQRPRSLLDVLKAAPCYDLDRNLSWELRVNQLLLCFLLITYNTWTQQAVKDTYKHRGDAALLLMIV